MEAYGLALSVDLVAEEIVASCLLIGRRIPFQALLYAWVSPFGELLTLIKSIDFDLKWLKKEKAIPEMATDGTFLKKKCAGRSAARRRNCQLGRGVLKILGRCFSKSK